MRMNKRMLLGLVASLSIALCATVASAMPTVGIGLQAELLPEIKDVKQSDVNAFVVKACDQLSIKVTVVSLDTERQVVSDGYLDYMSSETVSLNTAGAYKNQEVGW